MIQKLKSGHYRISSPLTGHAVGRTALQRDARPGHHMRLSHAAALHLGAHDDSTGQLADLSVIVAV